jgi:hypothetical protein
VKCLKSLLRQIEKDMAPLENGNSTNKMENLEHKIETHLAERKQLALSFKKMKQVKTTETQHLTGFALARRLEDESLYIGIDYIFQKYGIIRAAYHGGDLSGGGALLN